MKVIASDGKEYIKDTVVETEINTVIDNFIEDIYIKTQADFDFYFNPEPSQNYQYFDLENKNLLIKPIAGNVSYDLAHRVYITVNNVRIVCLEGARIRLTNAVAGFYTKNTNDLLVSEYNTSTKVFEVNSEDCYENNPDFSNYGDFIQLNINDELTAFSPNGSLVNKDYTVTAVNKNINEDIVAPLSPGEAWLNADTIEVRRQDGVTAVDTNFNGSASFTYLGNKYVAVIYIVDGVDDFLGLALYLYNEQLKIFERIYSDDDAILRSVDASGAITTLRVSTSETITENFVHVVFTNGFGANHIFQSKANIVNNVEWPTSQGLSLPSSSSDTIPELLVITDSLVYIASIDTSLTPDRIVIYSTSTVGSIEGPNYTFTRTVLDGSGGNPATTPGTINACLGFTNIGILNLYITYGDTSTDAVLRYLRSFNGGISWTEQALVSPAVDDDYGRFSRLIYNSQSDKLYVIFERDDASAGDREVFISPIENRDVVVTPITSPTLLDFNSNNSYNMVLAKINNNNLFKNPQALIQVVVSGDDAPIYYSLYQILDNAGVLTISTKFGLHIVSNSDDTAVHSLLYLDNDYIFMLAKTYTPTFKNYIVKHKYTQEITVSETIPEAGLSDIILSKDETIDNVYLDLNIDDNQTTVADLDYTISGTDKNLMTPSDSVNTIENFLPLSTSAIADLSFKVGNFRWSLTNPNFGSLNIFSGENEGISYGVVTLQEEDNQNWNTFSSSSSNGLKRFYLPKFRSGDRLGGFIEYFYNRDAWFTAFNGKGGSANPVVISQSGDVYVGSVSNANLVNNIYGGSGPAGGGKALPSVNSKNPIIITNSYKPAITVNAVNVLGENIISANNKTFGGEINIKADGSNRTAVNIGKISNTNIKGNLTKTGYKNFDDCKNNVFSGIVDGVSLDIIGDIDN